jgi:hypothetical protein
MTVFWDVTPRSCVDTYGLFRGICRIIPNDVGSGIVWNVTGLHSITCQMTVIFKQQNAWTSKICTDFIVLILSWPPGVCNTGIERNAHKRTVQSVGNKKPASCRYLRGYFEPSMEFGKHTAIEMMMDSISDVPVVSLSFLCYFLLPSPRQLIRIVFCYLFYILNYRIQDG